jgi:hypothetical protein
MRRARSARPAVTARTDHYCHSARAPSAVNGTGAQHLHEHRAAGYRRRALERTGQCALHGFLSINTQYGQQQQYLIGLPRRAVPASESST